MVGGGKERWASHERDQAQGRGKSSGIASRHSIVEIGRLVTQDIG
jgi:hypothetical protein